MTRKSLELARIWKFHDERPLHPGEVIAAVQESGQIVHQRMLWPLILTQYLIVARKPL